MLGRLHAEPDPDHLHHRHVIVVDREAALVLGVPQDGGVAHVLGVDLGLVEGDRVVAELLGDGVELAAHLVQLRRADLGEDVGEGEVGLVQRRQEPLLDHPGDVDAVDHEHVPVPGLGLLEQGESHARAVVFLEVDLDAVGFLEGADKLPVGVVAPGQHVQLLGGRRCRRSADDPRRCQNHHRHCCRSFSCHAVFLLLLSI